MWKSETSSMEDWQAQGWRLTPYYSPTLALMVDPPLERTGLTDGEVEQGPRPAQYVVSNWPANEDVQWFFSASWQEGESKVDEHIRAGRVQQYGSAEGFIEHLHTLVAEQRERGDRGDRAV